jgi:hypothetical protein
VHKIEKALILRGMTAMISKLFLLLCLTPAPSFARKQEEKRDISWIRIRKTAMSPRNPPSAQIMLRAAFLSAQIMLRAVLLLDGQRDKELD